MDIYKVLQFSLINVKLTGATNQFFFFFFFTFFPIMYVK